MKIDNILGMKIKVIQAMKDYFVKKGYDPENTENFMKYLKEQWEKS